MFIVSLTYKVELSEVEKHIDAHIAYLEEHYDSGFFLASGRKVPRTGGVILAQAENREALDAVLKEDPFYIEGVADFDVTEFVASKTAAGLERLRDI
ncbi:YciI family protein [Parasalinivibrio latis]|uniref:YciI family protein n=1 Tax=Parasalinivibrio latis TaxID=2952610 RepID=UPI0030E4DAA9